MNPVEESKINEFKKYTNPKLRNLVTFKMRRSKTILQKTITTKLAVNLAHVNSIAAIRS